MGDLLTIAGKSFRTRLILGTGWHPAMEEFRESINDMYRRV